MRLLDIFSNETVILRKLFFQRCKVINRNSCFLRYVATFLVRYGEIGLKGPPVRRRFESILVENIVRAHSKAGISCVADKQPGRLFVNSEDQEQTRGILSRTFGVVSLSHVNECSSDPEEISIRAVAMAKKRMTRERTFAIRARRTGSHNYTSTELASLVGSRIMEEFRDQAIGVSLSHPDIEIFIEVRDNRAFLFGEIIEGPGGLPLRSQGRVISIIGDRKSLLASWLMMRRGCNTFLVNRSDLDPAEIAVLEPWNPWWNGVIDDVEINIDDLIRLKRCSGIVFGHTNEELREMAHSKFEIPLFYPLIGMTGEEIRDGMNRLFSVQVPFLP